MERCIRLSPVLTLSLLLLLTSFSSGTQAEPERGRFVADTGIISLGPNQVLRIAADTGDGKLLGNLLLVRFKRMTYTQDTCGGGVCKHTLASQSTSAPVTLGPGEAASFDIQGTGANVRGFIRVDTSNMRDIDSIRATAQVINISTGEVTTHIIMANTEGDFH